jgi:hypothetical protein
MMIVNINFSAKSAIFSLAIVSTFVCSSRLDATSTDLAQISLSKGIDISKVKIGDIEYGMEMRQVSSKLGNPRTIKVDRNCLGSIDRLSYPGLTLDLQTRSKKKYVTRIDATGVGYGTDRGVKIGDSIEKAITIYGLKSQLSSDRTLFIPSHQYGDLFLVFKHDRRHKITQISIVFEC